MRQEGTSQRLSLNTKPNDGVFGPHSEIKVTIVSAQNYTVNTTSSTASGFLYDRDTPLTGLSVAVLENSVTEGDEINHSADFQIKRATVVRSRTQVNYRVTQGDVEFLSQTSLDMNTAFIEANRDHVNIAIPIEDDERFEISGPIEVQITQGGASSHASARITVVR